MHRQPKNCRSAAVGYIHVCVFVYIHLYRIAEMFREVQNFAFFTHVKQEPRNIILCCMHDHTRTYMQKAVCAVRDD